MKKDFAPLRNVPQFQFPWEGSCKKKPWQYKVTAVIPCLDTFEQVEICVKLLQKQTESPFIIVVDTGSSDDELKKLEELRSDSVEVHSFKFNGVPHPSDFPAIAMDFAFSACRTEYLFATHADCFLVRRDFLQELVDLCKKESPVVGYEISPRKHEDWKGMVSHTATMYHIPTMDKIGFGWSLRRLANYYNIVDYRPSTSRPGWPDTEILGNYILRKHKIVPYLIGKEQNFQRKKDNNIDHFRSYTSGKLYSKSYYKKAGVWYEQAKKDAIERIANWELETEQKELDVVRIP
jgi:glycosyltransferase involved in cell wall biosynthesis